MRKNKNLLFFLSYLGVKFVFKSERKCDFMKRIVLLLMVICVLLCLCSCNEETPDTTVIASAGEWQTYKLKISNDGMLINEVKSEYAAGEEVTIQLETMTEHYYIVTVNGVEIEMTPSVSGETIYSFIMPKEDVLLQIEDKWVDIPYPLEYEIEDGETYLIMPNSGKKVLVWGDELDALNQIDGYVLSAAEDKIYQEALKHTDNPDIYYEIQFWKGKLSLYGGLILFFDPPEGMEGLSGCGVNHEHLYFYEELTK